MKTLATKTNFPSSFVVKITDETRHKYSAHTYPLTALIFPLNPAIKLLTRFPPSFFISRTSRRIKEREVNVENNRQKEQEVEEILGKERGKERNESLSEKIEEI